MAADLRPAIYGINVMLVVLTATAISCRIGRRAFLVRSFHWHDALISFAALCAIIFSILQVMSSRFGLGLSMPEVSSSNLRTILKLSIASRIFYFVCNWAVKHSLLLFYAELTIDKWPRRIIYIMHAIAFGFGITNIGATLLQCVPLQAIWDFNVRGTCINVDYFNYFNSCFMLFTDIILYAMPLVFTWRLHLHKGQRVCANFLFALGALVLASSAARIYSVDAQAKHPDMTYRYAATLICAVIENHLAIIVACAPGVKVTLLHTFPRLASRFDKLVSLASKRSGNGTSDGSNNNERVRSEQATQSIRLTPKRVPTAESERSRGSKSGGRWWRAPTEWEVDTSGRTMPV